VSASDSQCVSDILVRLFDQVCVRERAKVIEWFNEWMCQTVSASVIFSCASSIRCVRERERVVEWVFE